MKKIAAIFTLLLFVGATAIAQGKPKSPPKTSTGSIGDLTLTINYNSPSKKGRTLWGDLVPYDKVWRTGANGASKVTFSRDATVGGKSIAAGTYSLFTIPTAENWTVVFNSVADQWGAYDYDKKKDVLRVEATPAMTDTEVEGMTLTVVETGFTFSWGKLELPVTVQ